jgi:hypothetical protein
MMSLACPKCSSNDAKSLSLIYREGLSIINTQTTTFGSAVGSGGGVAFGSSSGTTTGRQQSVLSRQAAPPARKGWILWAILVVAFGMGAVGGMVHPGIGTLLAIAMVVFSVRMVMRARKFNVEEYPGIYQRWERSFMCNRCGEVFAPEISEAARA